MITGHKIKRERSANFFQEETYRHVPSSQLSQKAKSSGTYADLAAPLLPHCPPESKASYFRRLSAEIDNSIFSAAHTFDKSGIYLYKRPVRSASPQHTALLAQAGSVFHHVVVYLKTSEDLLSVEFGPNNGMDVTSNMLEEAPGSLTLSTSPELPEPAHLPMLHIAAPHHPLDAEHIQQALRFAERQSYQVIRNNCIAFADFIVRSLTGNLVKSAPLIFDHLVGEVPPVDSPLLPMIQLMTQMSWHNIADGSRLMLEFLNAHGAHTLFLPGSRAPRGLLLPPAPLQEDAGPARASAPGSDGSGDSTCSDDTAEELCVVGRRQLSQQLEGCSQRRGGGPRLPPRHKTAGSQATSASAATTAQEMS